MEAKVVGLSSPSEATQISPVVRQQHMYFPTVRSDLSLPRGVHWWLFRPWGNEENKTRPLKITSSHRRDACDHLLPMTCKVEGNKQLTTWVRLFGAGSFFKSGQRRGKVKARRIVLGREYESFTVVALRWW
jgi:hypothetical protein